MVTTRSQTAVNSQLGSIRRVQLGAQPDDLTYGLVTGLQHSHLLRGSQNPATAPQARAILQHRRQVILARRARLQQEAGDRVFAGADPVGPAPSPYSPRRVEWNTVQGLVKAALEKEPRLGQYKILVPTFDNISRKWTVWKDGRAVVAKIDIATTSLVVVQHQPPSVAAAITQLHGSTPAIWLERRATRFTDAATGCVLHFSLSPVIMKRGALDAFFKPTTPKKPKYEASEANSEHASYPFAVPHLPKPFMQQLGFAPAAEGQVMNSEADLDMVYYQPYIPTATANGMFEFLRHELFFYRVQYTIQRGGVDTLINTPRFTTVFGVDDTSQFAADGSLVDAKTGAKIETGRYKCTPRPIPQCLDHLRQLTEGTTGETFNFCLVNYYADGKDSISYHSDDERFLGANPAIASFTLGAKRDFLMKHKPLPPASSSSATTLAEPKVVKLALDSGDMVLMRGKTQSSWLHSVPKRAGDEAGKGRINITFRKAMVKGGTENYYRYNVGGGGVYRWSAGERKMVLQDGE
jgi:alkylated DNA repair dioxygenase AlkB